MSTVTVTATVASTAPAVRTGNVVFTDGAITLSKVELGEPLRHPGHRPPVLGGHGVQGAAPPRAVRPARCR